MKMNRYIAPDLSQSYTPTAPCFLGGVYYTFIPVRVAVTRVTSAGPWNQTRSRKSRIRWSVALFRVLPLVGCFLGLRTTGAEGVSAL